MRSLHLLATVFSFLSSVSAGSNEASKKWLAENAVKDGVISLDSGMQYKILSSGSGAYHPTVNSPCECHYHGTLIDGTTFDSSYDRGEPTTFAPNQVIKGWTEAMQMMVEGDKWELYIPSELAYGDNGSPPKINGGDALIFTIEILKINGGKKPAFVCDPITHEGCNEKETKFAEKAKTKFEDVSKLESEIERIQKVTKGLSKEDLVEWAERRVRILKKLKDHSAGEL
eukprot:CAMPEP_0195514422 /NCGR_PEP_ID=MMETSP0794_2-20130614/5813_1 /TAXON_ID=515487 /ORGANISM="Stephanopyxis turris, Strain CCMP 815" /LENGTH=227 /DNA_ID=CAMNT_0040642665 /DNA_START=118 /DNA_END=801 /DNA_ORIENTATION=-